MNCKNCNTRVPNNERSCPHCGVEARAPKSYGRSSSTRLPAAELSTAKEPVDEEVVELDEVTDAGAPRRQSKKSRRRAKRTAAGPAAPARSEASQPLAASGAPDLRRLLAEDPGALEPGLSVFTDDNGEALGAGFSSGVGDIDLLASDESGDLVVVMISEEQEGEALVAEVLQRIGWVRKHVATARNHVRGIVLCEEAPASLSYTAAAVADTVRFKTWRVALSFRDLEI